MIILVSHLSLSNIAEAETQHLSVLCPLLLSYGGIWVMTV
ncbi:hypothetical protein NK6_5422 [Bradyrhizobium diazoefficiens]|uniref:Uncharacterized protein n=1 Tax=Bradyrhizobium diazoefficiens TaxID=1355477 RepID=A0A0E4FV66_9BRAD|nr:hypothetical protein NK6_5422 [Bradyrhizobium diazoefficiens]